MLLLAWQCDGDVSDIPGFTSLTAKAAAKVKKQFQPFQDQRAQKQLKDAKKRKRTKRKRRDSDISESEGEDGAHNVEHQLDHHEALVDARLASAAPPKASLKEPSLRPTAEPQECTMQGTAANTSLRPAERKKKRSSSNNVTPLPLGMHVAPWSLRLSPVRTGNGSELR